jgi:hypothetical protein
MKFHENSFSNSKVLACRQADMTKLDAFLQLSVANANRNRKYERNEVRRKRK